MIDKKTFDSIKEKYPFLFDLPDKLQELISDELSPNSNIIDACTVLINGKRGSVLLLENKLMVFWMTKLLFKKFPTIQEFTYEQINELKHLEKYGLYIHASANPEVVDENYEEGEFVFESSAKKDRISTMILSKSSRLNKIVV